jgi:GNAT superfamily N-acetyltransferase
LILGSSMRGNYSQDRTLFELISSSTKEEKKYVLDSLVQYNNRQVPFTQEDVFEDIDLVAKDGTGKVIGGINSMFYCWKILFIDILWVDEAYRGQGIGSQLMHKIQEIASEKGCCLIHLDTFEFQAKDFYLKQGFEIYGVLEDCPPGHNRIYFKKKIQS